MFDGPPPSTAEFARLLAGRLPLIPRYRQKARQVPFDLGAPVWVDDADFELDYHLRRTAVPAPGGDAELAALIGRIMSDRLDRARPLWEYWLVEGLAKGRWALLSKIHHCMVDGIAGTALYQLILDPTPDQRPAVPDMWHPEPGPSELALTAAAVRELALNPAGQVRAMARLAAHPAQTAAKALDVARGAFALAAAMWPVRASSLSGPLSAHRRYAFSRGRVAGINAVARRSAGPSTTSRSPP